jgi:magnesium-transporting ATPase (P-type)
VVVLTSPSAAAAAAAAVPQLSAHGAIVTRLASIEEMAGMNMLCSDKTGTLTLNKMVIQDDCPIYTPGVTKDDVLKAAALAAKWKEPPRDALDTLVLQNSGLDLSTLNVYEQVGGRGQSTARQHVGRVTEAGAEWSIELCPWCEATWCEAVRHHYVCPRTH